MRKNIINSRITAVRKKNGLTQEALAAQLCVTRQAVSNWEGGKSLPDIEMLVKIAEILGAPVESLIYDSDAANAAHHENEVGLFCKGVAITVYIVGFLWGIILGVTHIGPDDVVSLIFLMHTVPFWIKAFLVGSVLLGISEIIRLLGRTEVNSK